MTEIEKYRAERDAPRKQYYFYGLADPREVLPENAWSRRNFGKLGVVGHFEGTLLDALYSRFQAFKQQANRCTPSAENNWLRQLLDLGLVPKVKLLYFSKTLTKFSVKTAVKRLAVGELDTNYLRVVTVEEIEQHEPKAQVYADAFFLKFHQDRKDNPQDAMQSYGGTTPKRAYSNQTRLTVAALAAQFVELNARVAELTALLTEVGPAPNLTRQTKEPQLDALRPALVQLFNDVNALKKEVNALKPVVVAPSPAAAPAPWETTCGDSTQT